MMKKLMNKLIALGAMMFFGLTGCSNLNDAGNTLALDNSTQPDRCVVTVDTDAARAVIVAQYGESDINQWCLTATNVDDATDTYTTGNKTSLSELSLSIVKDETYDFTLTGIVGTAEVPGAVKGEIAARKITGNTRLSFTVKPSDATSTADPDAKGMAELKFDITGMDVMEDSMTGHGYKFVAKGQSGNAARKTENLPLEFDETAKTFKAKDAVLPTGIWELRLLCDGTTYCEGIFFAVEAGLTTKVTVVKDNLTIPGTGEVTSIYKDGIKNFTPAVPEDMLKPGAEVVISYFSTPFYYKLRWKNDEDGNLANVRLLSSFDEAGPYSDVTGNLNGATAQNGEFYIKTRVDTLRINPNKKTYTWYREQEIGNVDKGELYSGTSIKINGVDISGDFEYETYVKPVVPEDILAPNAKTEISFTMDSDNYKVTCINSANGNPGFPIDGGIIENGRDITTSAGNCDVDINDGKFVYTHFSTITLTIDPENKTFKWGSTGTLPAVSNTSITVNGTDFTEDFTDVTPSIKDMMAPNAKIEIRFKNDGTFYTAKWENDAEGNPSVTSFGTNSTDMTSAGSVYVYDSDYIFSFGLYALSINPQNKTYTWYATRDQVDASNEITNTNIIINGVSFRTNFTYKTYVPDLVKDLITPEKEFWLNFVYHYEELGDRQYQLLFKNNAEGTPELVTCIEGFLEYNDGTMKAEVVGDICIFVLPLHGSNYACIIDTANKTYTWRLENDSGIYTDALDDFEDTKILIGENDITSALTYKTYVNQTKLEDILTSNAEVKISYKNYSDKFYAKLNNGATKNPEIKYFELNGEDMTSTLGAGSGGIIQNNDYYFVSGLFALRIDTKNKKYTWYDRSAYVDLGNEFSDTVVVVNGKDITSELTYQTYVPVELMLQPKAKVQFNYTYDSISYEVNCENNEDGTPEYTLSGWNEESTGDNGILDTSSWSVSVDSYVYTLTMGKRALIIDFADRTYSWYNPTTFEDTGNKCSSTNIYVTTGSVRNQNIMSGFTYKTYVKSN